MPIPDDLNKGWKPDPTGRHAYRWWDGGKWTDDVGADGDNSTDRYDGPQPGDVIPAGTPGQPETGSSEMEVTTKVPIFGARRQAKNLMEEVAKLRAEQERLGILSLAELERRRDALTIEVAEQTSRLERDRIEAVRQVERDTKAARDQAAKELTALQRKQAELGAQLEDLRAGIVVTEETVVLQEVGIYEYRHPLSDAVAYQAELRRLKDHIKAMARKDGGAVLADKDWTVNNSAAKGRTMVRDYSKLMLRAYNAEADNLVRGMKPYKLTTAIDRLTKVTTTIAKLGKTMNIQISSGYHMLRVRELELTADYLEKVAEEKEREREERARLREERIAQQELERERARLEKERQHYTNALEALLAKGDHEAAARLREQLAEIDRAIETVDYRAANIRAGYVYVISNIGAFGDQIVKIGMTRRLEPMDRVRELGDASVPFRFDVHALFFSDDAVGIESKLHATLADRRVNRVNLRREFFYASPSEVKEHLAALTGELLTYDEQPEALEYRQSLSA